MTSFFFALCLATLFVETFAQDCEWEWEYSDPDCWTIEWSSWSSCSGGTQTRWREVEIEPCFCDYEDQTRSCPSECLSH